MLISEMKFAEAREVRDRLKAAANVLLTMAAAFDTPYPSDRVEWILENIERSREVNLAPAMKILTAASEAGGSPEMEPGALDARADMP